MTCLWGCHWQRMVIIKKNPLLPVYINQPPYLWMLLLWCGDTWLLRNRFERREEKVRRRTASGKTIAIPADPGTERKLIRSHLPCQIHNPNQFPSLLWGRCPNPTQGFSCSRRRCCSTLTAASFHDSGKSFIEKCGLCFPVRLTVLCIEFSFEVSVITWICTSQTFQLWQIVWVIVHCVVIYSLKVCMATETPVWGRVKHLLLKRMSIGLKFAQHSVVNKTLLSSRKLAVNWVVGKHLLSINWMNDHDQV